MEISPPLLKSEKFLMSSGAVVEAAEERVDAEPRAVREACHDLREGLGLVGSAARVVIVAVFES